MNTKNKTLWVGLAVIVVLVLVGVAYAVRNNKNNQGSASGDMVKIGVIAPLSGDTAAYGTELQKVLDYELVKINAQPGTKFVLDYEDGKCTGKDAVAAFQKLTNVDGVKIIIGGTCSGETLGIAPLTKDGAALAVSSFSSNPTIEGASPYVFSLSYSDEVVGNTLADQMSKFPKIAIITEQGDYAIGVKNVFEKELAKYPNAKIVADETFPQGSTDFRSLLAKVRNAAPDAILLNPLPGVTAPALLKQLAEVTDWKGYKLYGQFTYLGDDIRSPVGNFAEGMTIVDAPAMTDPTFLAYQTEIQNAKGTLADIGNYYTASSLDDLDILTSLIRKVGNDPKAVRDALSSGTFQGYLGTISFDGHSFKQGSQGGVYIVQGGKAIYQPQ
jgi:ABC-type branched-subunit amino acid transport system substrate-binding protein